MPLFIELKPLEEGDVKREIETLAQSCNFNLTAVYKADLSKRSSKQQAFVFGLFSHTVGLGDTLLEKLSPGDIVAVIGHEIGHSVHHHVWKGLGLNQIVFFLLLLSLDGIMKSDAVFGDFGFVEEKPFLIGLLLLVYLVRPIGNILELPMNLMHRWMEYEADAFAVKKGLDLKEALLKASTENKIVMDSDPLWAAFHESHPNVYERVEAIRKIEAKNK